VGSREPVVDARAYVADNATVIGDVTISARASVWFGAVLRGDVEAIRIGEESNVQDGAILHTDPAATLTVGRRVTIGHGAVLHGCTVHDGALIGIRATVLDHAIIGRDCLVGAHALVTSGQSIPDGSLVLGAPAKVVRQLSEEEIAQLRNAASHYVHAASVYRGSCSSTSRESFGTAETLDGATP
jgi:carbonic anhydrase/acetyltransferase-like protein (isoleucine patch superfamily)